MTFLAATKERQLKFSVKIRMKNAPLDYTLFFCASLHKDVVINVFFKQSFSLIRLQIADFSAFPLTSMKLAIRVGPDIRSGRLSGRISGHFQYPAGYRILKLSGYMISG